MTNVIENSFAFNKRETEYFIEQQMCLKINFVKTFINLHLVKVYFLPVASVIDY